MKYRPGTLKKYQLLSDKINDEQWSTPRLKEFWKKNRKFEKWFKENVLDDYSKESGHRFFPSKFRGEYGEGK